MLLMMMIIYLYICDVMMFLDLLFFFFLFDQSMSFAEGSYVCVAGDRFMCNYVV